MHTHTHTHACTHTHTHTHTKPQAYLSYSHWSKWTGTSTKYIFHCSQHLTASSKLCLNTYLLLTGATNFYTHPKMYQESHLISFLGIYLSSVWAASTIFRFSYFVPIIIHGLIVTLTWRFLQTDATRETTRTTISLASGLSSLTCRLFISWSKSRVNLESASNHFICNCNF